MELGGGPLKNPHWRGPGGARGGPARGPGTRGQRSRSPSPPQHAGTYGGPPMGDVRVDLHDGRPASSPAKEANEYFIFENEYFELISAVSEIAGDCAQDLAHFLQIRMYFRILF